MPTRRSEPTSYLIPADADTLGYQIRKRRLEKGWSQTELAEKVADALGDDESIVTQSQISAYELGKVKTPSLSTLRALDEVFGVEPGTLLSYSDWPGAARRVKELPPPGSLVIREPSPNMIELIEAVVMLPDDELPRLLRSASFWIDKHGAPAEKPVRAR